MKMPQGVALLSVAAQQEWMDQHGLVLVAGHLVRREVVDVLGLPIVFEHMMALTGDRASDHARWRAEFDEKFGTKP